MQNFNQFKPKKHTLDIPSMPQNEKEYTYFGKNFSKFHKKITQKRLFKPLAAGTLALFMGIGTLCGVLLAPMNSAQANASGATASSNASNLAAGAQLGDSTQKTGLIIPQQDDPIIAITSSGIEIKYGVALTGNLAGFPYIITNDGTSDYYWVIIGTYSEIKGANLQHPPTNTSNYLESNSVAGQAISKDNLLIWSLSKGLNMDSMIGLTSKNPKSELSSGQVLCLANTSIATGAKNTSVSGTYGADVIVPDSYLYFSTYEGTMATTLDGYTSKFGLSAISSYMKSIPLKTKGAIYNKAEDGVSSTTKTSSHKIFTLSGVSTDTFYYLNYLTATQASTGGNWWLRGANDTAHNVTTFAPNKSVTSYFYGQYVNSSGNIATALVNTSYGYRPAFVLQL